MRPTAHKCSTRTSVCANHMRKFYWHFLQDDRWRSAYGILKANLLFIFNRAEDVGVEAPFILLILEDCYMELCDDNATGRAYSFQIKFKT